MVLSNTKRAKNAELLIWIVLLVEIVALISAFLQYDLIEMVKSGETIAEGSAESNDIRERVIGGVYLVTFIISSIYFIKWFRRAYYNIGKVGKPTEFTDGWAAGAWFVPVIHLYRPYNMMKELFQNTYKVLKDKDEKAKVLLDVNLLGIWWACWVINNIIGQVLSRMSRNMDTLEQLSNYSIVNIISSLITIPTAWFAVKIIRTYSSIEPLLAEYADEVNNNKEMIDEDSLQITLS